MKLPGQFVDCKKCCAKAGSHCVLHEKGEREVHGVHWSRLEDERNWLLRKAYLA